MRETDDAVSAAGLHSSDKIAASDAGRALGRIKSESKAEAARRNSALRKTFGGPPVKDPLSLECTCGAGNAAVVTFVGETHKTTCPRGRLLYQRAKIAARKEK